MFILAMSVWLVALILVIALVVDSTSLYRHRQIVQRSADLGVLAGLGYRALKGWGYFHDNNLKDIGRAGRRDAEVEAHVRETIIADLSMRRISVDPDTIVVHYSSWTDQIDVHLEYDTPLMLASYVPGIGGCSPGSHTCRVSGSATAELQPANIGLVLDTSGSMNCPVDGDASCECLPRDGCQSVAPGARKLAYLQDAVKQFMAFFNPNRDRVTLVPFNAVGKVAFSVKNGGTQGLPFGSSGGRGQASDEARINAFYDAIDRLDAAGNTNICDGVVRTFADLSATEPNIVKSSPTFLVLFTDGAPSAGRFHFTDLSDSLRLQQTSTPALAGDWWIGSIDWANTAADGQVSKWLGPSPLVQIDDIPYGYGAGTPPGGADTCGNVVPELEEFRRTVNPCLRSFRFDGAWNIGRPRLVSGDDGERDFDDVTDFTVSMFYLQQFYYCAIEATDAIRDQFGGLVYTIGLGPEAYSGSADPFQDPSDAVRRKAFFLRRVALDRFHGQRDPAFGPRRDIVLNDPNDSGNGRSVTVGYNEYRGYDTYARIPAARDLEGSYEGSHDPRQLRAMFVRIAKDILIRLTG